MGVSIITSCVPTPLTFVCNPVCDLALSHSFDSIANLFGTTRIFHPFSSQILNVSLGVTVSFPGQKGHVLRNSGGFLFSFTIIKSSGFLLFSLAIITHSRVIGFNLISDMLYLQ